MHEPAQRIVDAGRVEQGERAGVAVDELAVRGLVANRCAAQAAGK